MTFPAASSGRSPAATPAPRPRHVVLLGATGTIGRATLRALLRHGHRVTCLGRRREPAPALPPGAAYRGCDLTSATSVRTEGFGGLTCDAVISCLASRSGAPDDAWAIDHRAHSHALAAARESGATHFVLLSAICVQRPRLAFQHAKLAFERELMASDITWSIVRATAYFKSLSGQLERLRAGKPFLVFGDGALTACKPISDDDLAGYLVGCLDDPARQQRVLPIGGPGPALTPRAQGELLAAALGVPLRVRAVSPRLLSTIAGVLDVAGRLVPPLRAKAEFARIGHYYATESMLVWDEVAGRYDADATPEFGTETLAEHYAKLVRGERAVGLGEHAVF